MIRGGLLVAIVVGGLTAAAVVDSAAATSRPSAMTVPPWLRAAERQTLHAVFGDARPTRIVYLSYPHKIAVIFEFSRVVVCGACSAPSNDSLPHGRVIRVSYDRSTHRLTNAYEFCEVNGGAPARAFCLRR